MCGGLGIRCVGLVCCWLSVWGLFTALYCWVCDSEREGRKFCERGCVISTMNREVILEVSCRWDYGEE